MSSNDISSVCNQNIPLDYLIELERRIAIDSSRNRNKNVYHNDDDNKYCHDKLPREIQQRRIANVVVDDGMTIHRPSSSSSSFEHHITNNNHRKLDHDSDDDDDDQLQRIVKRTYNHITLRRRNKTKREIERQERAETINYLSRSIEIWENLPESFSNNQLEAFDRVLLHHEGYESSSSSVQHQQQREPFVSSKDDDGKTMKWPKYDNDGDESQMFPLRKSLVDNEAVIKDHRVTMNALQGVDKPWYVRVPPEWKLWASCGGSSSSSCGEMMDLRDVDNTTLEMMTADVESSTSQGFATTDVDKRRERRRQGRHWQADKASLCWILFGRRMAMERDKRKKTGVGCLGVSGKSIDDDNDDDEYEKMTRTLCQRLIFEDVDGSCGDGMTSGDGADSGRFVDNIGLDLKLYAQARETVLCWRIIKSIADYQKNQQ